MEPQIGIVEKEGEAKKKVMFDSQVEEHRPAMKMGGGFLNLRKLDDDFILPEDGNWQRQRTMGQGAYGKVMECLHIPSG